MDTNQKIITLDRKAKLSTLWIFFLLNVIFRDLHELFRSGFLERVMDFHKTGAMDLTKA
jgi:hypothetical protein